MITPRRRSIESFSKFFAFYEPLGRLLLFNVLTKDTVAVLSSMVGCITFLGWSKCSVLSPLANPSQSLQKGQSTSVT